MKKNKNIAELLGPGKGGEIEITRLNHRKGEGGRGDSSFYFYKKEKRKGGREIYSWISAVLASGERREGGVVGPG